MSNVLKKDRRQQVLALGQLDWPLRRIEEATGVRRETASAYLKAAGMPVRPPGGWGRRAAKPAKEVSTDAGRPAAEPANELSTHPELGVALDAVPWDQVPKPGRSPTASACDAYQDFIEESLRKGRNAKAIWQDLVDDHGFAAGYASVKRFVRKLRGSAAPEVHPVIFTSPGEEAQVDYGSGPMVRHPETGKYRRTRLFVLTLGYSRKCVRLLTWRSSSQIWAQLHEQAFRRLGAVPALVVLDNLREGVLTPDIYDPTLNPLYRDVLAHYGAVALPCRVRDPNRKGKVESGVGHAQKTPLKGLRFEGLAEAQAYLDRWEERWGDTRIHGRVKRQVAAMFAEEMPHLVPLPVEPFRYYQHGQRTVHLDGCIEVEGAYYEAPPRLAGATVPVQWDERYVRLLDPVSGQLVMEHRRAERGRFRLRNPEEAHRLTPGLHQLLARAQRAGPHIGALCEAVHRREGVLAARRILGVLSLARKHGAAVTDDACAAALELGAPSYRFVRRYLGRQRPLPLTLRQVDPIIRDLVHYRDFIHQMTGGGPS
jgi:transposase